MSLLSNREIAIAVWLILAFAYYSSKGDVRLGFLRVISAFLQPIILIGVGLMIIYTLGIVVVLSIFNFWDVTHLKGTIIWFCFTATVLVLNYLTTESSENAFANAIKNNVKLTIAIAFIITTYTFSLVVELVMIPLGTLIVSLDAFSLTRKEYSDVAKLTTSLVTVIGFAYLFSAMYGAATDYEKFLSIVTLKNFLLAPVLSVSFLPFIYVSMLVNIYFRIFRRLKSGREKERSLNQYAKRKIILHCRLSVTRTNGFLSANSLELMRIRSKDDVDRLTAIESS